jgi:hypothetical protein
MAVERTGRTRGTRRSGVGLTSENRSPGWRTGTSRWVTTGAVALLTAVSVGCGGPADGLTATSPESGRADTGSVGPGADGGGTLAVSGVDGVEVHTLAEGLVADPMLAIDHRTDTVYAVWTAREPSHEDHADHADHADDGHVAHQQHLDDEAPAQLHLAASRDGGRTFADPVRVDGPDPVAGFTADPRSDRPTQVVVTDDGAVHVVWVATRPIEGEPRPANDLRIASSRDGGRTFEPPRQVVSDEQAEVWRPGFHRAIVAPDGALHIAFLATPEEADTVGRSVRVVTSRDEGRSFQPGEALTTSTCQCCPVSLAVRADGRIALAWRHIFPQADGTVVRDNVAAFSHDGGSTWSPFTTINDDGWLMEGCPHSGPALATGPDGRLHVAWYTGRQDDAGVRFVREGSDETFEAPTSLVSEGFFPVTQPALDVAPDGTAWIAWDDQREDEPTVWLARVAPDGAVTGGETPIAAGRSPRVAITAEHTLVTWHEPGSLKVAVVSPDRHD